MSREEALTAVLNSARALKQAYPLELARQTITNAWMVGCFAQLYSTVDAVDAVGAVEAVPPPFQPYSEGLCSVADCWRYADLPTRTCHQHSPAAQWPQVRRRDPVFQGEQDG